MLRPLQKKMQIEMLHRLCATRFSPFNGDRPPLGAYLTDRVRLHSYRLSVTPRHEFIKTSDLVIRDTGQNIGQPCLRIRVARPLGNEDFYTLIYLGEFHI